MANKTLAAIAAAALMASCAGTKTESPLPDRLSLLMARSEMKRTPHPINLDFRSKPKWEYSAGLELWAMLKAAKRYNDKEIFDYVYAWPDSLIDADGNIYGYRQGEHNIDRVNSGKLLLDLYDDTREERFKKAADMLRAQMYTHPRTKEGGYWHKQVYENQMWLDGLYMGAPYVAQWAARNNESVGWDMMRQFTIVGRHTFDPKTGLHRHAWDEARTQFWADTVTGQSRHAWGRANGWYMMAMTDILEYVPDTAAGRGEVMAIYQNLAKALLGVRDSVTGMWFQVLDCPGREGNYVESTCSAMFVYSFLKGARMGYLPQEYSRIGREAFQQFVKTFVRFDADSTISVTKCCAVAGLGGSEKRDGTYKYYLSEPVRDNDPKAVGPFILASLEME